MRLITPCVNALRPSLSVSSGSFGDADKERRTERCTGTERLSPTTSGWIASMGMSGDHYGACIDIEKAAELGDEVSVKLFRTNCR